VIVPSLQHLGLIERPDLFTRPILNFLEKNMPQILKNGTT
jgi:hypothetical protein